MRIKVGMLVTFWYENCEYLGRVLNLNGTRANVKVLVADEDFLLKFGTCITLSISG